MMVANRQPDDPALAPGARVRVVARTPLLELRADRSTIIRKDSWADYYLVRLDKPAHYHAGPGAPVEELWEIREDADDLRVLR